MTQHKYRTNQISPLPEDLMYELGVTPTGLEEAARRIDAHVYGESVAEIKRDLSSQPNGVLQTFTTPENYESGSLEVFWSGNHLNNTEVTELGPNTFSLNFAPLSGETLFVRYLGDAAAQPGVNSSRNFQRVRKFNQSTQLAMVKLDGAIIIMDTSDKAKTLTLPGRHELVLEADGVRVNIVNQGSNELTIYGGGGTINGLSLIAVAANRSADLVYVHSNGWFLIEEEIETDLATFLNAATSASDSVLPDTTDGAPALNLTTPSIPTADTNNDSVLPDTSLGANKVNLTHLIGNIKDATPDPYVLLYYED